MVLHRYFTLIKTDFFTTTVLLDPTTVLLTPTTSIFQGTPTPTVTSSPTSSPPSSPSSDNKAQNEGMLAITSIFHFNKTDFYFSL